MLEICWIDERFTFSNFCTLTICQLPKYATECFKIMFKLKWMQHIDNFFNVTKKNKETITVSLNTCHRTVIKTNSSVIYTTLSPLYILSIPPIIPSQRFDKERLQAPPYFHTFSLALCILRAFLVSHQYSQTCQRRNGKGPVKSFRL